MNPPKLFLILAFTVFFVRPAAAQVEIRGTVYDQTQQYAMPGVSVLSTSGIGTMTDSLGHYHIRVPSADSLYFSYLGRATARFPVRDLPAGYPFDMSLQVTVDSLPSVYVRSRNYLLDSLENRKEYQKVFDYSSHYLTNMKMERRPGVGMGFDLDMLLDGKANRRMEAMQSRLIWEEQDKYIDHHWNMSVVRKLTGLESPALDTFMRQYRPSYDFIKSCETDYEYYNYIQRWGKFFEEDWKLAHKQDSVMPMGGGAGGVAPGGRRIL
ncbi:MAG TPA: hypothetical protein VNU70_08135 [Puia sp.]|nr:hypothetical protein [Puia sp.]